MVFFGLMLCLILMIAAYKFLKGLIKLTVILTMGIFFSTIGCLTLFPKEKTYSSHVDIQINNHKTQQFESKWQPPQNHNKTKVLNGVNGTIRLYKGDNATIMGVNHEVYCPDGNCKITASGTNIDIYCPPQNCEISHSGTNIEVH